MCIEEKTYVFLEQDSSCKNFNPMKHVLHKQIY